MVPDDARYVFCAQCAMAVLALHARYAGERSGPDLLLWPVWICEACDEEMDDE